MKAAVGRLDFAPGTEAMKVTDIETGHFVFTSKAEKEVSFRALQEAIQGAGYEIERASIEVTGTWVDEHHLEVRDTGQRFHVTGGERLGEPGEKAAKGSKGTVSGEWAFERDVEVIRVRGGNAAPGS